MAEQDERREILLWAAAAGLLTAVGLCAVISAPDFAPAERVVYSRPPYTASAPLSSAVAEKINLNNASRAELLQISGIGDVTADKILAYRDSHGGFHSLEELLQVDGIGEKKLEEWRPYLTVE